jgi:probable F420-dependent oxidoreductase
MYPGDELAIDVSALDSWIDTAVSAGYDHLAFGDHVVGVDPATTTPGWDKDWPDPTGSRPAYTINDVFREPLIMLSYAAARCSLELVTGIMVLPQRQTVLVAKQAAEVDWLSNGRIRLGVGIGWNQAEYVALGMSYQSRGRVLEEQVEVLRRLWTEPAVTYEGGFHSLSGVGLQALPIQRPIPLWMGGESKRALERAGRLADGFFLTARSKPTPEVAGALALVREVASVHGRQAQFGVEARLIVGQNSDDDIRELSAAWVAMRATHLCIDTRYAGFTTIDQHLRTIRRVASVLDAEAQPES